MVLLSFSSVHARAVGTTDRLSRDGNRNTPMETVKVPGLVNYGVGVKAGVAAGLAQFVFLTVANYVFLYFVESLDAFWNWRFFYIEVVMGGLVPGIVFGVVIGIIFAMASNRVLKSLSLERKGVLFGIVAWLIFGLPGILALSQIAGSRWPYLTTAGIIAFSGFLIFGITLGKLYKRFNNLRQTIIG